MLIAKIYRWQYHFSNIVHNYIQITGRNLNFKCHIKQKTGFRPFLFWKTLPMGTKANACLALDVLYKSILSVSRNFARKMGLPWKKKFRKHKLYKNTCSSEDEEDPRSGLTSPFHFCYRPSYLSFPEIRRVKTNVIKLPGYKVGDLQRVQYLQLVGPLCYIVLGLSDFYKIL